MCVGGGIKAGFRPRCPPLLLAQPRSGASSHPPLRQPRQINVNGNQLWLNRLDKLGYKICHDRAGCEMHKEEGWAAVKPHPNQFYGRGAMCTPDRLEEGLCADRRLYVHAVCRNGHKQKIWAFMQLGLW